MARRSFGLHDRPGEKCRDSNQDDTVSGGTDGNAEPATINEAETCRTLVRPKLEAAGWDGNKHFFNEQTPFTDGRIIVPGGKPRRLKKKFSDFLLRYTRHIILGVVEAKPLPYMLCQSKENDRARKVNFAKEHEAALSKATTHWDGAMQAESEAGLVKKDIESIDRELAELESSRDGNGKSRQQQKDLKRSVRTEKVVEERRLRELAKTEKATSDSIYWPVFNLDRKNPNAKHDFEHLPPEKLADDTLQKELPIAEIMLEIRKLLGRKP